MGIYDEHELEKNLFEKIRSYRDQRKIYPYYEFVADTRGEFEDKSHQEFLQGLVSKGYISIYGVGVRTMIDFGKNAREWRRILEEESTAQEGKMTPQQNVFIGEAHTVQTAGHDINNTFTEADAENVVKILKEVLAKQEKKDDLLTKISKILSSGTSAIAILKALGGLLP